MAHLGVPSAVPCVEAHPTTPSCLHAWLGVDVGPRAAPAQQQLWDTTVLKQWAAGVATPSLHRARTGIAGLHDIGTGFIWRVLNESLKVWLAHTRAGADLIKGPQGTTAWALRELQLHPLVEQQGVPREALN